MGESSKPQPEQWALPPDDTGVKIERPGDEYDVVDLTPPDADYQVHALVKKGVTLSAADVMQVRAFARRKLQEQHGQEPD